MFSQLRTSSPLIGPEGSLPHSQEPALNPYPQPGESSPNFYFILVLSSYLYAINQNSLDRWKIKWLLDYFMTVYQLLKLRSVTCDTVQWLWLINQMACGKKKWGKPLKCQSGQQDPEKNFNQMSPCPSPLTACTMATMYITVSHLWNQLHGL
jgi:hypothetical protein